MSAAVLEFAPVEDLATAFDCDAASTLVFFAAPLAEPAAFLGTFLVSGRASLAELFTAIWGLLSVSGQETNPCQVTLTGLNAYYYTLGNF